MRSTRTIAAAILTAAALASPASAMPIDPPHGQGQAQEQPPIVVQSEPKSGFDWTSAAVGAAGGVGAFAIALAAGTGLRRRRTAHPGPALTH